MKRIVASICAALAVLALAWIAGFDFSERGVPAVLTTAWAIWAAFMTYTWPGWDQK